MTIGGGAAHAAPPPSPSAHDVATAPPSSTRRRQAGACGRGDVRAVYTPCKGVSPARPRRGPLHYSSTEGALVRKILFGAVLVALLAFVAAAPALAASGPLRCSPNEVPLIKVLKQRGVIPRDASAADATELMRRTCAASSAASPKTGPSCRNGRRLRAAAQRPHPLGTGDRPHRGDLRRQRPRDPGRVRRPSDYSRRRTPRVPGTFPGGPLHGDIAAPADRRQRHLLAGPRRQGLRPAHYQEMLFGTRSPSMTRTAPCAVRSTDTMRELLPRRCPRVVHRRRRASPTGSRCPIPSRGTARNDVSGDDLTGPAWRVARDAVDRARRREPGFDWANYDNEDPFGIDGDDHLRPARRLRRPPDHRPRRRRRVGRRRRRGRRRHLGALLVGRLGQRRRPRRRRRLPDPRHSRRHAPAGHLGRPLHAQSRRRRHRRLLPRVRPRPRSARPVRHHLPGRVALGLLDAHGARLVARQEVGHRLEGRRR